jgi:hypothetical protein
MFKTTLTRISNMKSKQNAGIKQTNAKQFGKKQPDDFW